MWGFSAEPGSLPEKSSRMAHDYIKKFKSINHILNCKNLSFYNNDIRFYQSR